MRFPYAGCCEPIGLSYGYAPVERIFNHNEVAAANIVQEVVRI